MAPTKITELPNEILLEIFKRVPGSVLFEELPSVSEHFNALAKATKPLFSIEDNGMVEGNIKDVQDSFDKNLYITNARISGIKSRADLDKIIELVKRQPGLKDINLRGDIIASSQSEATQIDKSLKEAIVEMKYLEWLVLDDLYITTASHKEWVGKTLKFPYNRQSLCTVPWTEPDLKKLLASNRRLKVLLLPKVTIDAFNFLMEDPAAENWRCTVLSFWISGLHYNRAISERDMSWKILKTLKGLEALHAGELDEDFWKALPKLSHLNALALELTMTGLVKITSLVKEDEEIGGQIQLQHMILCCHESIDWEKVPGDVVQKFIKTFQVESLVLECRIGNPIDVGNLVSTFSHWPLKKLCISVYHTEDRSLDLESVMKLEQPSLPNLEELMISTYVQNPASDIDLNENEILFQPVLQRLFQGTRGQLVTFENMTEIGGTLQVWANKDFNDLLNGYRPNLMAFPSWEKQYPKIESADGNLIERLKTRLTRKKAPFLAGLASILILGLGLSAGEMFY